MPSIKSCFAALAFAAMAFAPIASAKTSTHGGVAKRGDHSDKRALAKAAAAKRAASRKATRTVQNDIYERSGFNKGPIARAARARRCANDAACQGIALPTNGQGACTGGSCVAECKPGFAPVDADTCVDDSTCGGTTCSDVSGGYNTCSGSTCVPTCYSGTTLVASGSTYSCVDTSKDATCCGSSCTVCPESYAGTANGSPRCYNGACTLTCPAFENPRKATSISNPYYCA